MVGFLIIFMNQLHLWKIYAWNVHHINFDTHVKMCKIVGEYSRLGVHMYGLALYGKNLLNNLRGIIWVAMAVLAPLVPTPMWQSVLVANTYANCFIDSCLYLNMFLPIVGKKHSRLHCGLCAGCQWSDCGLCINCKDMKKFVGPAKKKKACKLKSLFTVINCQKHRNTNEWSRCYH